MHLLLWAHFGSPTFGTAVRALLCRRNMRAWVRARACFVCRLSLLSGLAACIGSHPSGLSAFRGSLPRCVPVQCYFHLLRVRGYGTCTGPHHLASLWPWAWPPLASGFAGPCWPFTLCGVSPLLAPPHTPYRLTSCKIGRRSFFLLSCFACNQFRLPALVVSGDCFSYCVDCFCLFLLSVAFNLRLLFP